jgi:hypothetical protein
MTADRSPEFERLGRSHLPASSMEGAKRVATIINNWEKGVISIRECALRVANEIAADPHLFALFQDEFTQCECLVDDAQDTDPIAASFLRKLCEQFRTLFCSS